MSKDKQSVAVQKRASLPPRNQADLLDRIQNMLHELHSAEQQAASLILSDPEWVIENSIKAFANRAKVSEPTIMRLSRKLDLNGFATLKRKLTEDLVVAKMYLEAAKVVDSSTASSVIDNLLSSATKALHSASMRLDGGVLDRSAELIAEANMVYCLGVGGSSAIFADEAENRLFRLGISAQSTADAYRQRMAAAVAKQGDVFLCISSTGRPRSLIEAAQLARSNNANVISITMPGSQLAEASSEVLTVEIFDDETFFNLPSRTRYSQLFSLDCLMATVATRLPNSAEYLKSIRLTLSSLHGVTKHQPIGD
ncbi:MurR/RpiR family transcriptional regulator [uncultured Nitratireductor sp.]|uniref:MurR/RpiR family transcriptional regulator n=1 Tax=uncultured Nitratireductor sp. TaxID=520953 RepID=UPI002637E53A|nr:MurR/RpiR family transcriptional regulator [uncultured Nitratireductor sp.]